MKPVAVVAAAAVSPGGLDWRGLAGARGSAPFEVGPIAPTDDAGDARQRKLMSRPARLAAIACRRALAEAGWRDRREDIGYYLGVGASGGPLAEIDAILAVSVEDGAISLARLGDAGLRACNPLFTFQVLNNFTMCHGAILEGLGGPNGAFFSRGTGTVAALAEAAWAVADGDCARALAGGADSALHPVTLGELERHGFCAEGLVPGEGAGILALAAEAERPLAVLESCAIVKAPADAPPAGDVDVVVIAPWGEPPRAALTRAAGGRPVVDVTAALGESLAATPALAWLVAIDLLQRGARRALVLSAGIDGDVGAVALTGGDTWPR